MGLGAEIVSRIFELIIAPIRNPGMLWAGIPLIAAVVIITMYYHKFPKEEQGWENAVGNTLVLIFVGADLLRYVYTNPQIEDILNIGWLSIPAKTFAALLVLFEGISMLLITYNHFLPRGISFLIASPLAVNLTAYVAMAVVYSNIPLDRITLLAAVIMFLLFYPIILIVTRRMPKPKKWLGKIRG